MTVNELMEKKIENLIKAIRRDLISKNEAYNQFLGYTKAFTELKLMTPDEAGKYRDELAKVLY